MKISRRQPKPCLPKPAIVEVEAEKVVEQPKPKKVGKK